MCTSFVYRKGDNIITAMNFDNNGMPFSLKKDNKKFVVLGDAGKGKRPSFGVNSEGTFINNLMVNSNGKGLYKRASSKVSHTSKLTEDILDAVILKDDIKNYLQTVEVVNCPGFSVHNMIADKQGNVIIAEPGRGVIYSTMAESPFFIMTNFSLCDYEATGIFNGCGTDRYLKAKELLNNADDLDIAGAFEILNQVKQSGEWTTVFSFVYSAQENAVYFCYNADFCAIEKFAFV